MSKKQPVETRTYYQPVGWRYKDKYSKYYKGENSSETDKYAQFKSENDADWRTEISFTNIIIFESIALLIFVFWFIMKFAIYPTSTWLKFISDLPDMWNFMYYALIDSAYILILAWVLMIMWFTHAFVYIRYKKVNAYFLNELDSINWY